MKRALAWLLSLLMALSLFPATAFAEEETPLPESPAVTAEAQTPDPAEEQTPTPAPAELPSEAPVSESPTAEALFLTLLDCDSIDSDGAGHSGKDVASASSWSFTANAESNGALHFRWQKLDQSASNDSYIDLEESSASEQTLTIAASQDAIGVKDYYRCVITAERDEETMRAVSYFTVNAPKAEETLAPEGALLELATSGIPATSLKIVGSTYLGIGEDLTQTYTVQFLPTGATIVPVVWSVEYGTEYAEIDAETGKLTGTGVGDVTIRATSSTDEDVYGELVIHVDEFAIQVTGAERMVASKTLQLVGKLLPINLTKTTILWSMDPTDVAYASVSSTGLVTAKAVTEPHSVTVYAVSADAKATPAQKEIIIYPALNSIQILDEYGANVSGKTLILDSTGVETLAFSCALIPSDATPDITWTLGITDAATMTVSEDGFGVTITPVAGKSKLVMLSAKANDGSGKTAMVKIQISAVSSGLSVSGAEEDILYANRKVQLVATFDEPVPSNKTVKWVLSPEYDAYATLSSTGMLTAKAVTQAVEIEVIAIPADGGPQSDPYLVTIKPLTSTILLKIGDDIVTGTTRTVDLGHETAVPLTVVTWPDGADENVTFTSSAPAIATVDDSGIITPVKTGSVTITVRATDGSAKTASVRLNIINLPQEIEGYPDALSLRGGGNALLRVKDTSSGALVSTSLVRWSMESSDAAFASLTSGGVFTARQVTQATTITVTAEIIGNEEIANTTMDVTIYPATQRIALYQETEPVSAPIVFDVSTMTKDSADSAELTARMIPADAMSDVTWTTSNATVAKVVDGVVTPVWNSSTNTYNKGIATITAKTKDGTNLSARATIQVVSLMKTVQLTTTPVVESLVSGTSVRLKAIPGNLTATNPKVAFSITSGSEYATLSTAGILTAKTVYQAQTVTLLASASDGSCEATLSLTILPKEEDPFVIQTLDGGTILNDTVQYYDVSAGAAIEWISANGFVTGNTVSASWSVSPSSVARVEVSGGQRRLRSISTGTVTVTAKDSKGRTASFKAVFYKPAESLTIKAPKGMDITSLMLASGKTMQLTGTIAPTSGVTTSGVNWFIASDSTGGTVYLKDTSLASISTTGVLTAKPGLMEQKTITVYAVTKNAPYLADSVNVTLTPAATGIDLFVGETLVSNATMGFNLADKTMKLSAVVYPGDANQQVTWTSSNKTVATIDSEGNVIALKAGSVTLTATADGKSVYLKLNIRVRVSDITINSKTGFTMRTGGSLQLTAGFTPTTPTDKRVTWKLAAEDAQYATITSTGLIRAKTGTQQASITVTLTSLDDSTKIATQTIGIYPATTRVQIFDSFDTDVTGKTLALSLNDSTTMTLSAKNLPSFDGGALQSVTWKSSNTTVLKVNEDGVLSAVLNATTGLYNTGTVTITATAKDGSGKSASVKVFVGYLVESLTFSSGLTVQGGRTLSLKPTFNPANATNKTLKWVIKDSDTPYATLSTSGVLTAKKVTETRSIVIYCYAQDGSGVMGSTTVTITR